MRQVYDLTTGTVTEEADLPLPTADDLAAQLTATRAAMSLSFGQLLIGLVAEGWITQADGAAWLAGTLPAQVTALIATLPADQQFAATVRATTPSVVLRTNSLVVALSQNAGKTDADLDTFFRTYAAV